MFVKTIKIKKKKKKKNYQLVTIKCRIQEFEEKKKKKKKIFHKFNLSSTVTVLLHKRDFTFNFIFCTASFCQYCR